MNTKTTATGAGTSAAQLMPVPELFDACMDHLINVQGKTERVALDIMSEGAAGTLFAALIAKRRAA